MIMIHIKLSCNGFLQAEWVMIKFRLFMKILELYDCSRLGACMHIADHPQEWYTKGPLSESFAIVSPRCEPRLRA